MRNMPVLSWYSLRGHTRPTPEGDVSPDDAVRKVAGSKVAAGRRRSMARTVAASLAATAVGVAALTLPASAWSERPTAPTTTVTTEARVMEPFAARQPGTSRDAAAREELDTAAADDHPTLAQGDDAAQQAQITAQVDARAQSLLDTRALIEAEAERLASHTFFWPTEGGIASPWGMRLHPILRYKRLHGGADIGGAAGAPIYAVLDGTITKAALGHNSGSGNNIRIDHGDIEGEQLETAYLHMESLSVSVGQKVTRGQLIGTLGSTGLSTSPHLHFSVYAAGANTDPAPYLVRGQA